MQGEEGAGPAGGNASFFRTDFRTFRHMGATKVQLTLSLLEGDNGVETVVVSDSGGCWRWRELVGAGHE